MTRQAFIAYQSKLVDEHFALAPGENAARSRFEQLAIETYDCIVGKVPDLSPFVPYPSVFNFADYDQGAGEAASPSLRQRWREWKSEYKLLLERRPVLELYEALRWISGTHTYSSWPYGYEEVIRDWVDAGDRTAPFKDSYGLEFEDRYGLATPEFFERLRWLRQKVAGWLYWDDAKECVIFATDEEWARMTADQR
jgi:hypothetical protein